MPPILVWRRDVALPDNPHAAQQCCLLQLLRPPLASPCHHAAAAVLDNAYVPAVEVVGGIANSVKSLTALLKASQPPSLSCQPLGWAQQAVACDKYPNVNMPGCRTATSTRTARCTRRSRRRGMTWRRCAVVPAQHGAA